MTNEEIISRRQKALVAIGKIQPTGRMLTDIDQDGNTVMIPEPEEIHTFAVWKEAGYIVKRGQHAVDTFMIWKYPTRKKTDAVTGKEVEVITADRPFLTKAFFFARHQVERIA